MIDQLQNDNEGSKKDTCHTSVSTCSIILSKGKRKGLPCSRKIISNTEMFCKFHMTKSLDTAMCTVILTKGERKNKECNRKVMDGSLLCKRHLALEKQKPFNPYTTREFDVHIVNNIASTSESPTVHLHLDKLCPKLLQNLHWHLNNKYDSQ